MKLASSFTVPAAPDKVLALFLDPVTMQACIPGCEELVRVDDTHYRGKLANEVAHVRFKAGFTAEITSTTTPADTSEPAVVRAVMKGEDRRLGSTIKVDATLTVSPGASATDGDTSTVAYEMELAMWGKLGRLGESVIRRRTAEVEASFAEAFSAVAAGQPIPERANPKMAKRAASRAQQSPEVTVEAADAAETRKPVQVTERSRDDLLILGLAISAAFAYGIIVGGWWSKR